MHPAEPSEKRAPGRPSWLLLIAVFVAGVAVTLFIGTRGGASSSTPTFPDVGDLAGADPNVPATDETAPVFKLQTYDGDTFDLAQHLEEDGRPLVLNLWASWCPPCRAEMPAIDAVARAHPEVAFIGVAVQDTAEGAEAFATEIGVSYPLAFDDGTVDRAYPVMGLPVTFFIDPDGKIVKRHFGIITAESLTADIAQLFGD